MGKETETKQQTQSKEKGEQNIPSWLENVSRQFASRALDLGTQEYQEYTDPRVADFSGDQQTAFQMIRNFVTGGGPNVMGEAQDYARQYADSPAQTVSTERVVDENGRLGAIADYMNPYQGALDTAIRKITEAADTARLGLNARMTGAGAFGDARHGVEGAELNQNYMTSVGDVAGKFLMDAYDKAFGLRSADLNRFLSADTTQAGLNETALGRLLQGATGLMNFQGAGTGQELQKLSALLGIGGQQQAKDQAELDAAYQEFLRQFSGPGSEAESLRLGASVLGSLPHSRTMKSKGSSTTTTTQPDNSLWDLAGTLAGAALAPATGGASLALPAMFGGGGQSIAPSGAAPYAGNPYSLPWL